MNGTEFEWESLARSAHVDPRVARILSQSPHTCATLDEYAKANNMATSDVVELLGQYLDSGLLSLDFYGDAVFLNTAPQGRDANTGIPANMWEQLRSRVSVAHAYALWQLLRSLESVGWDVEYRISRILFGLGRVDDPPYLGVVVGQRIVPALIFPSVESLVGHGGLFDQYEQAGCSALAVICDEGALDEMVTALRRWAAASRVPPTLRALVLEAPRYNPVLITPHDAAIEPVSVSRDTLGNYFW